METLQTIDLMPLVELAAMFVVALLGVALNMASRYIKAKTGVELDLKHNATINEAIDRGVAFARSKLADKAQVTTSNALVAGASQYVVAGAPKALEHFGITPDRLAEMIEARLVGSPAEVPAE